MSAATREALGPAVTAEWLKLRTIRGVLVALAVLAAGVAAMAGLAWYAVRMSAEHRVGLSPLEPLITQIAQLCLGVAAVLAATTDVRDGAWRLTLTAVPRRGAVVAGKAAVVGVLALVAGCVAVYATSWSTRAVVGDRPLQYFDDPRVHGTALLVSDVVTVPMIALSALGLGLWLRSTAGAITLLAGTLFVLPVLAQAVPAPAGDWLRSVEPDALPDQLAGQANAASVFGHSLGPTGALAVMIAYPALLLGVGTWRVLRRDA